MAHSKKSLNNTTNLLQLSNEELKNIKFEKIQQMCINSLEDELVIDFLLIRTSQIFNPILLDSCYERILPMIINIFNNHIIDINDKCIDVELNEIVHQLQIASNFMNIITDFLKNILTIFQEKQSQLTKYFVSILKIVLLSFNYKPEKNLNTENLVSATKMFSTKRLNILAYILPSASILNDDESDEESRNSMELLVVLTEIAEALLELDECVAISLKTWKCIVTLSINKTESIKNYGNTHWMSIAFSLLNAKILAFVSEMNNEDIENDNQNVKLHKFYIKILCTLASTYKHEHFHGVDEVFKAFKIFGRLKESTFINESFIDLYYDIIDTVYLNSNFKKKILSAGPTTTNEFAVLLLIIGRISKNICDNENGFEFYMEDDAWNLFTSILHIYKHCNLIFHNSNKSYDNILRNFSVIMIKSITKYPQKLELFESALTNYLLIGNLSLSHFCMMLLCCLIKNISSQQIRYTYFQFWKSILDTSSIHINSPVYVYVQTLVIFTFDQLSDKFQQKVVEACNPQQDVKLWSTIGAHKLLRLNGKESSNFEIVQTSIESIDNFLNSEETTAARFYEMLKQLKLCSTIKKTKNEELLKRILKLWNFVNYLNDHKVWNSFVLVLVDVTANNISFFNNMEYTIICNSIHKFAENSNGSINIRFMGCLISLATTSAELINEPVITSVSKIFCTIYKDQDKLVRRYCVMLLQRMSSHSKLKCVVNKTLEYNTELKTEFESLDENNCFEDHTRSLLSQSLNTSIPEHKCNKSRNSPIKKRKHSSDSDDFNFESIDFGSLDSLEFQENKNDDGVTEILQDVLKNVNKLKSLIAAEPLTVRNFNSVKEIIQILQTLK